MKTLLSFLIVLLVTSTVSAANWPPNTASKVANNALEYPTKLDPVNTSLEEMLNNGASIISSYVAEDGPIITIKAKKKYVICLLKGAGTGSDQNIATSKCYAMN